MKHRTNLAPAAWAHHSWLGQRRAILSERAARAANACLLMRFPNSPTACQRPRAGLRDSAAGLRAALPHGRRAGVRQPSCARFSAPARQVLRARARTGAAARDPAQPARGLDPLPAPTAPDWRERAETTAMGLPVVDAGAAGPAPAALAAPAAARRRRRCRRGTRKRGWARGPGGCRGRAQGRAHRPMRGVMLICKVGKWRVESDWTDRVEGVPFTWNVAATGALAGAGSGAGSARRCGPHPRAEAPRPGARLRGGPRTGHERTGLAGGAAGFRRAGPRRPSRADRDAGSLATARRHAGGAHAAAPSRRCILASRSQRAVSVRVAPHAFDAASQFIAEVERELGAPLFDVLADASLPARLRDRDEDTA